MANFFTGLVSFAQAVRESAVSSLRSGCAANLVVSDFRGKRHGSSHVGDVVHTLHTHRTSLLCVQQSRHVQRQPWVMSVHQSARTRSSLSIERTWRSLQTVTRVARRFRCIPERNHPAALGWKCDNEPVVLNNNAKDTSPKRFYQNESTGTSLNPAVDSVINPNCYTVLFF